MPPAEDPRDGRPVTSGPPLRDVLALVLVILGAVLVVVGVALFSPRAAVIAGGVACAAIGVLLGLEL